MAGKPRVLPALWLAFAALLGSVMLGFPLYLLFAVLLASVVNTFWGVPWVLLLTVAPFLALLVLAVTWLRRPAGVWRFHGTLLLGGLLGGGAWFGRFGLSGLV